MIVNELVCLLIGVGGENVWVLWGWCGEMFGSNMMINCYERENYGLFCLLLYMFFEVVYVFRG